MDKESGGVCEGYWGGKVIMLPVQYLKDEIEYALNNCKESVRSQINAEKEYISNEFIKIKDSVVMELYNCETKDSLIEATSLITLPTLRDINKHIKHTVSRLRKQSNDIVVEYEKILKSRYEFSEASLEYIAVNKLVIDNNEEMEISKECNRRLGDCSASIKNHICMNIYSLYTYKDYAIERFSDCIDSLLKETYGKAIEYYNFHICDFLDVKLRHFNDLIDGEETQGEVISYQNEVEEPWENHDVKYELRNRKDILKKEIYSELDACKSSIRRRMCQERSYMNSRLLNKKIELYEIMYNCKSVGNLLNFMDLDINPILYDIVEHLKNTLKCIESELNNSIKNIEQKKLGRYGDTDFSYIEFAKLDFSENDVKWILNKSEEIVSNIIELARNYISDYMQTKDNNMLYGTSKSELYKRCMIDKILDALDSVFDKVLKKVIEYYSVEILFDIKNLKSNFNIWIKRNTDKIKLHLYDKEEIQYENYSNEDDCIEENSDVIDRYVKSEYSDTYKKDKAHFISENFFPSGIAVNGSEVFPMVVLATMSSGKSTLINALLGQQILPSRNEACTAKKYLILDDDLAEGITIYITYKDGKTVTKEENIAEELENANNSDDVTEILIKGDVKGVLNTDRALLIVDTPGPNNSRDASHEQVMKDVIAKISGGLFLYVLNATQMGINDDKYLLSKVREHIKKHPQISLLFVMNKVDQLDEERGESVEQFMLTAGEYLMANGIEDPRIIPVSALSAGLFKKVLNGEELTRSEYRTFVECYEVYKPLDYSMKSFAITDVLKDQHLKVDVRGEEYAVRDLNRAIENTGIKLLEEEIQKAQILSSGAIKNNINIERGN